MEHQCLVCPTLERVLFMASQWDDDALIEERHYWYTPDPARRQRIIAGWVQFQADVSAWVPYPAADAISPAVTQEPPAGPPTLKLGEINVRLKHISVSADALRALEFAPAVKERSAVLYHKHSFAAICDAIAKCAMRAKSANQGNSNG
jgi:hypothetical protein